MSHTPEKALWQEVLLRQVDDALLGPSGVSDIEKRTCIIKDARAFLTKPSKHLELICLCAGMDADAVITRMRAKIADAPTVADLVTTKRKNRKSLTKRPKKTTNKPTKYVDRLITFEGESLTYAQWADRTGLTIAQIASRLRQHWTVERALTQPVGQRNRGWGATGVVSNLCASIGTGGGRSLQDRP